MGWGEGYYHYLRFWPSLNFMRFIYFSLCETGGYIIYIYVEYMVEEFHLFCMNYSDDQLYQRSTFYTQRHKPLHRIS